MKSHFLRYLIFASCSSISIANASAGEMPAALQDIDEISLLNIDTPYAKRVLNWQQQVTEKPLYMLRHGLDPNTLTLSATYWGSQMWEETNTADKFPILSRFPNQHSGTSDQRWVTNNAAIGLTAKLGNWVTVYAQPEYSEIEFLGQKEYQMRKAFAIIGNLESFPVYAYVGRNTVDFGWQDAYNPFTHSVNNHFFRIDTDEAAIGLGYYKDGLHLIATAIPSGRQLRVADTVDGDGGYENFAFNASYQIGETDAKVRARVGGGYLYSSIYNRDVPNHPGAGFAPAVAASVDEHRNGAWDVFAELMVGSISLGGEFTATEDSWPATDHRVSALTGQVAYDFDVASMPSRLSFVYGVGRTGPDDTEYERLKQLSVGLETQVLDNFSLGIEYVRNAAFVPLIGITQVSDADVRTDTLILGGKITF